MARFDGSLARTLDFGEAATTPAGRGQASICLASGNRDLATGRVRPLRGPDKYLVLDHRRRAAQIRARHAVDLIDAMERFEEGR